MEIISSMALMKVASALCVVIGLFFAATWFLKRFDFFKHHAKRDRYNRRPLCMVENMMLDSKRRLLVVEWAGEEHMILLGHQNEMVIKSAPIPPVLRQAPIVPQQQRPSPATPQRTEMPAAYEKCS